MALPIRSEPAVRGIATSYNGVRFRSRLEARYAAFFDLIGWSWVYEPFDTADWIPDFLIQGDAPFLVEVGPCDLWSDYSVKAGKPLAAYPPIPTYCERIAHENCHHEDDGVLYEQAERTTLVLGIVPIIDSPYGDAAGLLTADALGKHGSDPGIWSHCPGCGMLSVTHATGTAIHMPCGHAYAAFGGRVDGLLRTWNQASTPTQWRPFRRRRP